MKKFFSLVLCICIVLNSSIICAFAQELSSPATADYCSASIQDNFEEDCLLVSIRASYSEVNRVWTPAQLGVSNVAYIEDLTAVAEGQNDVFSANENFEQMLKIHLSSIGKKNVLDMMNQAIQCPYISYVSPSFIFEIVQDDVATDNIATISTTSQINDESEYYPTSAWNDEKFELYDIGAVDAWDEYGTGSATIKVGIMDTGIATHEDLEANIIEGKDFMNNGTITSDDSDGHGTFIAGLIGAVGGNGKGITGVNWNVSLVPLQISMDEELITADAVSAFLYAGLMDIDIINCSFGVYCGPSNYSEKIHEELTLLKRAMSMFDGLIVCAAGNDSMLLSYEMTDIVQFPAMTDLDNVICVGATCKGIKNDDSLSERMTNYSNYSPIYVDIMAPGGAGDVDCEFFGQREFPIGSDELGNLIYPAPGEGMVSSNLPLTSTLSQYNSESTKKYDVGSGTSYATPLVAGAAALLLSHNPNLTAVELKYILMNSVDTHQNNSTLEDMSDYCVSGGRLNVYHALQMVLQGNQTRTIVAAVKIPSSTVVSSDNYTFTYDVGKYELVSATPVTVNNGSFNVNTLTPGEIKLQYIADTDETIHGRVLYCQFQTRLNIAITTNELQKANQETSFATCSALLGDVDNNNLITTNDARLCLQLVSQENATDVQLLAADCDGDGIISTSDAQAIMNMSA